MRKSIFKEYKNKTSASKRYSRITQGGDAEIYSNRIGWWERDASLTQRANDDITIILDDTNERRPHLIADEYYGRTDLTWIILQYNNIVDINEEFVFGREIEIPSLKRVFYSLTLKNTN